MVADATVWLLRLRSRWSLGHLVEVLIHGHNSYKAVLPGDASTVYASGQESPSRTRSRENHYQRSSQDSHLHTISLMTHKPSTPQRCTIFLFPRLQPRNHLPASNVSDRRYELEPPTLFPAMYDPEKPLQHDRQGDILRHKRLRRPWVLREEGPQRLVSLRVRSRS